MAFRFQAEAKAARTCRPVRFPSLSGCLRWEHALPDWRTILLELQEDSARVRGAYIILGSGLNQSANMRHRFLCGQSHPSPRNPNDFRGFTSLGCG